jgi:hypothetical protein
MSEYHTPDLDTFVESLVHKLKVFFDRKDMERKRSTHELLQLFGALIDQEMSGLAHFVERAYEDRPALGDPTPLLLAGYDDADRWPTEDVVVMRIRKVCESALFDVYNNPDKYTRSFTIRIGPHGNATIVGRNLHLL